MFRDIIFRRTLARLNSLLIALVFSIPLVQAGVVYDLATDWSTAANPNGVWSYNQGTTALPYTQLGWGGITGTTFWTTTASGTYPPAWALITNTDFRYDAGHWEPGMVIGHSTSAGGGALGTISWTSPSAGVITVSGSAWDAWHVDQRVDAWQLYINDILVAQRTDVTGIANTDAAALFANNLLPGQSLGGWAVSPGDTVVFQIQAITSLGHFVGVDLSVDLSDSAAVPEPSSAILVLSALVGAGFVLRRRKAAGRRP